MEQKIVAFFDLLGWKALVEDIALGEEDEEKALTALHILRYNTSRNDYHGVYVSTGSDTLVISANDTNDGLISIIRQAECVSMSLFSQCGLLLRGGIARGAMSHDERGEFGPALNVAAKLCEKKGAPARVACCPDVADMVRSIYGDRSEQILRVWQPPNGDAEFYINTLWHFEYPDPKKPVPGQLSLGGIAEALSRLIERELNRHCANPAVLEKWNWQAEYWDNAVSRHGVLRPVGRK